jgi:hypothetical protein
MARFVSGDQFECALPSYFLCGHRASAVPQPAFQRHGDRQARTILVLPPSVSPQLVTCRGQRFWYCNAVSDAKTQ